MNAIWVNASISRGLPACLMLAAWGTAVAADAPKALPLEQAVTVAQAAVAQCKANGYNVTVMVMDPDYTTRLVLRSDAAAARTVEIARRKAYTVIKMGMSSGEFGKSVPAPKTPPAPQPPGAMPPGVNGDDNLITFAGGKQIIVAGQVAGALSVSGAPGGDKDEACADAGLAKLK
jgi:uncharacterized protein GlcG (DUF336 family)